MTIHWVRPTTGRSEPVYLYDVPGRHVVNLKGIFITQHGKKIRVVSAAIRDLDRISKTPEIGNRDNEEMQDLIERYLKQSIVNIIGGCCGTSPDHIRLMAEVAKKYIPRNPKTLLNV